MWPPFDQNAFRSVAGAADSSGKGWSHYCTLRICRISRHSENSAILGKSLGFRKISFVTRRSLPLLRP